VRLEYQAEQSGGVRRLSLWRRMQVAEAEPHSVAVLAGPNERILECDLSPRNGRLSCGRALHGSAVAARLALPKVIVLGELPAMASSSNTRRSRVGLVALQMEVQELKRDCVFSGESYSSRQHRVSLIMYGLPSRSRFWSRIDTLPLTDVVSESIGVVPEVSGVVGKGHPGWGNERQPVGSHPE
jgi:hypothetical protein